MVKISSSIVVALLMTSATILTGCNKSINSFSPNAAPRPLPSVPAHTVASSELTPINNPQPVVAAPTTPKVQQQVAAIDNAVDAGPTSSSREITREGMAGSWQVPTDGHDCRIILAFTKWSGGYRAATRRCISAEMQAVNAWDVKDQSVVLVDQSGNEVARLFATQSGRYDGRTKGGYPVSFTR